MAEQLSGKNGFWCRLLLKWMARAKSSFPVPVSPVMRTVASVPATWLARRTASRNAGDCPRSRGKRKRRSRSLLASRDWARRAATWSARWTVISSCWMWKGLESTSRAPSRRASTAICTVP